MNYFFILIVNKLVFDKKIIKKPKMVGYRNNEVDEREIMGNPTIVGVLE